MWHRIVTNESLLCVCCVGNCNINKIPVVFLKRYFWAFMVLFEIGLRERETGNEWRERDGDELANDLTPDSNP